MKKIAVFPGSFDPITKGHQTLIKRALNLFDEVIVAIGINVNKKTLFSTEERIILLEKTFAAYPQVKIDSFSGLTVDFCKKHQIKYILRGLRSTPDFEYEKTIHEVNKLLSDELETVLLFSDPELGAITSSIVRELIHYKGNIEAMVPLEILDDIRQKMLK